MRHENIILFHKINPGVGIFRISSNNNNTMTEDEELDETDDDEDDVLRSLK